MKFIKQHKKALIILAIIIVLIILLFSFFRVFLVDPSKSVYGDRLDGMDKVKISSEATKKLEKEMSELNEIEKADYHLKGRLIYVNLLVKDGVPVNTAKDIANKVLEYFTDEERAYYDIQIILSSKNEQEGYPVMGYKHKTSYVIIW